MKRFFAATTAALMVSLVASVAIAAPTPTTDVMGQSWRVYNVKPATSSFWDINKVKLTSGELTFPIQQFESVATGSFAVYLRNNYNVDMTGMTLTADMAWTDGEYMTRSTVHPGAYVRFEFQDTTGAYDSNNYWWSTGTTTGALDLNVLTAGELSVSLATCALWSNQNGMSACDDTTVNWTDWAGKFIAESPAEGFATAMKNVKQLGLSFGSAGSYASGIALDGDTGTFTVSSFTVQ